MTEGADTPPKTSRTFVALLIAMTALAPVSLQIFIPALPAIQSSFESSTGVTQLVLSLSILANAVATLLYGPLSDRFGRRPVVMVGFLIFVIGSVGSALAPTIGMLIIARIIQSAGAAAGMVLARAIVRDLYDRDEAASVLAYLTMAMVAAPMLAPTFGAVLIDNFSWRAIFVVMAFLGIVLSWQVWSHLEETHVGEAMTNLWRGLGKGGISLLRRPSFLAYTLQSSFAISTFFAFIAGAPYFVINGLGRSATEYGLLFMAVSASFMVGNFTTARLSRRYGTDPLIRTGNIIALCGASLALGSMILGYWNPFALFGPMMLVAFGNGLSIANAQAGAVSVQPNLAGTASGIAGFAQMFVAALVSQAVGMLQNGTPYPMVGFMALCAALSLLSFSIGKSVIDTQR
jgi:DHA1 family bicyclomycin/chloramphenicol resistance-like MFS transporter